MSAIRGALARLARRQSLSGEAAAEAFREIMRGTCSEIELAGLLVGLAAKGETPEEIAGAARALRESVIRVPLACGGAEAIDTCGTGGSGVPRRNVSTAAALALAACGAKVAKHGNRAASSKTGSADVLAALGVDLDLPPELVGRCVDELGVGFLYARRLHPAAGYAAPVRAALGVRTVFNVLGPICNPAFVQRQALGLYDPAKCTLVAETLAALGTRRAFVVHGFRAGIRADPTAEPGIDDLSLEGESLVVELAGGRLTRHVVHPSDVGLVERPFGALAGEDPAGNARALAQLLGGRPEPAYLDAVAFSGGLAWLVAFDRPLDELGRGVAEVKAAIVDGRAQAKLAALASLGRAWGGVRPTGAGPPPDPGALGPPAAPAVQPDPEP